MSHLSVWAGPVCHTRRRYHASLVTAKAHPQIWVFPESIAEATSSLRCPSQRGAGAPDGVSRDRPGAVRANRASRVATNSGKNLKFPLTCAPSPRDVISDLLTRPHSLD